jgi:hypothetical protein
VLTIRRRGRRSTSAAIPGLGGTRVSGDFQPPAAGVVPSSAPAWRVAPAWRGPCTGHVSKRPFTNDFYVCTNAPELAGYRSMPPKARTAAAGRLIGYARVSTEEQGTDPQTDELRAARCTTVHEERASGADRLRPVLGRLAGPRPAAGRHEPADPPDRRHQDGITRLDVAADRRPAGGHARAHAARRNTLASLVGSASAGQGRALGLNEMAGVQR